MIIKQNFFSQFLITIKKIIYLILLNTIIILLLLCGVDLILGEWIKPEIPVSQVPAAIWNKRMTYDVSGLYGSSGPEVIHYTRDSRGYRGLAGNENKKLILTIGGSTTDQRFVTDGEDWPSKLNKKIPKDYAVVNGGVDGQSSYGHLFSIRNWHSKELPAPQVSLVIYYFGANDGRLLLSGEKGLIEYDNLYSSVGLLGKIRIAMSRNSFIYAKMRLAKNNLFAESGLVSQGIVWAGHAHRSAPFNDNGKVHPIIDPSGLPGFKYYTELIQQLTYETHKLFPSAKIIFVQEQIPGCRFLSEEQVIDRYPYGKDETTKLEPQHYGSNNCSTLGQIYLAQMRAVSGIRIKSEPRILKMYLSKIIQDEDVYDTIHTMSTGSDRIANYLYPFVVEAILK